MNVYMYVLLKKIHYKKENKNTVIFLGFCLICITMSNMLIIESRFIVVCVVVYISLLFVAIICWNLCAACRLCGTGMSIWIDRSTAETRLLSLNLKDVKVV